MAVVELWWGYGDIGDINNGPALDDYQSMPYDAQGII